MIREWRESSRRCYAARAKAWRGGVPPVTFSPMGETFAYPRLGMRVHAAVQLSG